MRVRPSHYSVNYLELPLSFTGLPGNAPYLSWITWNFPSPFVELSVSFDPFVLSVSFDHFVLSVSLDAFVLSVSFDPIVLSVSFDPFVLSVSFDPFVGVLCRCL